MANPQHALSPEGPYELMRLFGQRLRSSRILQHETQAALATRTGLTRGTIMRAERGDPNVSFGAVVKLTHALYATDLLGAGLPVDQSLSTRRRVARKPPGVP